jgi:hypothetical protein
MKLDHMHVWTVLEEFTASYYALALDFSKLHNAVHMCDEVNNVN